MITKIKKKEKKEKTYPYLGKWMRPENGAEFFIVFFNSAKKGMIIYLSPAYELNKASYRQLGEVGEWDEEEFVTFDEELILKN